MNKPVAEIRAAAEKAASGLCEDCVYNVAGSPVCDTCSDVPSSGDSHFKPDYAIDPTTTIELCDALDMKDAVIEANIESSRQCAIANEAVHAAQLAAKDEEIKQLELELVIEKDAQIVVHKCDLQAENKQLRELLRDALPHIECTNATQSGLITEIGQALNKKGGE